MASELPCAPQRRCPAHGRRPRSGAREVRELGVHRARELLVHAGDVRRRVIAVRSDVGAAQRKRQVQPDSSSAERFVHRV